MPRRSDIDAFLALRHVAVVGVSRQPRSFANDVYRRFAADGRTLYPVNEHAGASDVLEGDPAFRHLADLPPEVEGVVLMVPRDALEAAADEVLATPIRHVWLHRGAGQPPPPAAVVERLRIAGVRVVDGACPLMFLEPVRGIHRAHRFVVRRRFAAA